MTGWGEMRVQGHRGFLETLEEADRVALLAAGSAQSWARGEVLVRSGDIADSAIVLLHGWVKVHRSGADGTEVVLGLSGAGDLLGEISALGHGRRYATATALADVTAAVLAAPDLRGLLSRRPGLTLALLDLAIGRLVHADERRAEFVTSESLARVAGRLVELAERFGEPTADDAIDVALPITQEELASWSSSSKESTARALRTLRDLGVIRTRRRGFTVVDLPGLQAHVAATPAVPR